MPCRNEEVFIGRCVESVIANEYPKDRLELLVVDGMSEDRTMEIVGGYAERYPFIRIFTNPGKMQTYATNIGLRTARGEVVIRMDAHAEYPASYISRCVGRLEESQADCVGGTWVTKAGKDTVRAKAIALALTHPFGVGNAHFRTGVDSPREVDTVPFGCYRKEVFDRVGLFNENLDRTDDIEFNLRLKRNGGKILLFPDISSVYYARTGFRQLARQNFGNGFWVIYSLAFAKTPFSARHLVPLAFVLSLLGSLSISFVCAPFFYLFAFIAGLYLAANMFVSLRLSLSRGLKYFPALIAGFLTLHVSYGAGSLWGTVKLGAKLLKGERRASL